MCDHIRTGALKTAKSQWDVVWRCLELWPQNPNSVKWGKAPEPEDSYTCSLSENALEKLQAIP